MWDVVVWRVGAVNSVADVKSPFAYFKRLGVLQSRSVRWDQVLIQFTKKEYVNFRVVNFGVFVEISHFITVLQV